jgi:CubicO group peptidase (beta-lactamase class C family)
VLRPEAAALRASLRPAILRRLREEGVVGLSLALTDARGVLWAEGFGYADGDDRRPARADTVYRAGSLAKPFAAAAVLQLASAGRIDLDRPLADYLPEFALRSRFPGGREGVTPRRLLCHQAGLPSDLLKAMWTAAPYTALAQALGDEYAAFPPGLLYSYSNVGYSLLGHAVEAVTGVPYPEHLRSTLFEPLGMHRTALRGEPPSGADAARGHRDGRPATALPLRDVPAYGLHTTATDMARFAHAFLAGGRLDDRQVLPAGLPARMLAAQPAELAMDTGLEVGLGWYLEQGTIPGAGRVARHGGTTLLYAAELVLLPDQGLGVAVLSNTADSRDVVARIAEAVLAGALGGAAESALLQDSPRADAEWVPGALQDPAGSFATTLGLVAVLPAQGVLCACIADQPLGLVSHGDGSFTLAPEAGSRLPAGLEGLAGLRLAVRQQAGREVLVANRGTREVLLGERLETGAIPAAWLEQVGDYTVVNPDPGFPLEDLRLRHEHGVLCLSYRLPALTDSVIRLPLRPVGDTEAVIAGLGRARGETVRVVERDGEALLRFSGFLARRVGP